ncbi:gamma carbonic anhydrase family protein [Paraburkholderia phytofirmans]|uniref:Transferase hexapeptide repeat containing protein n=1 Tax=Paraburkholderia phytofirmans (strain DSM 17436 / LMG 22146 / PsJN) TaxID=398527 RepID=B2T8S9_PARPJ|nr:gamma carbonic anhydrase family protein [Paraburkholderia phytofirmans]ACD20742.1 transferase hexapeptide repeat containing protein [Paraburkholderia phytofirmans PsJN]
MTNFKLNDKQPFIKDTAFVSIAATIIGDVHLLEEISVWPGAVIRGDNDRITVGRGSNVQDGAILHTDAGFPLVVGEGVSVGHAAVLHGCTVGNGSLIGIHATILNGAVIGQHCIVAAGAVIPECKQFPDRSLIMGVPGKAVRQLSDDEVAKLQDNAQEYVVKARVYKVNLKEAK